MFSFSYAPDQSTICFVSFSKATCTATCLQNRLYIIEYEQAAMIARVLDKEGYLTIYFLR